MKTQYKISVDWYAERASQLFAKLIYVPRFYTNNINFNTGLFTKSMRLQRRLYGIYSVFILMCTFYYNCELISVCAI